MTTENKRYIVLPPEEKPTTVHAKSINPTDETGAEIPLTGDDQGLSNFNVEREDFFEASFNNNDQDITIGPSGKVDQAYELNTKDPENTTYMFESAINKSGAKGSGQVVRSGSVTDGAYTWKPDAHSQYKLRENHNGFHKFTDVLQREYISQSTQRSFSRPTLLPMQDGNLLLGYCNNHNAPWAWTYSDFLQTEFNQSGSVSGDLIVNSPSGRYQSDTIRIQIYDRKNGYWKNDDKIENSFKSGSAAAGVDVTGVDYLGYLGTTGLAVVQYEDSGEILAIYCGYMGSASHSFRQGYLCVDEITQDFSDFSSLGFGTFLDTENRCRLTINNNDDGSFFAPTFGSQATRDIPGLANQHTKPLGLSANILPSGRLVVAIAYEDGVYSLVSDDRGRTFQASQVMDTLFNDTNYRQRVTTVSTCLLDSGALALLVTGNGLGDRSGGLNTQTRPLGTARLGESVISVFVTGDGVNWGSEKKLAGGAYQPRNSLTDTTNNPNSISFPNDFRRYNGESVYPLSGSITQTPDKSILVSIVGVTLGGAGGGTRQGIYTRTLNTREITGGESGFDLAPSWHPYISTPSSSAIGALTPRFQPATKNIHNFMDQGYTTTPPTTSRSVIFRRYAEVLSYGEVMNPNVGFVGQNSMFCQPVSLGYAGPMSYGGGPLLSTGSIDIATCVYKDSIVTVDCWLNEFGLGNSFPNANESPIPPGQSQYTPTNQTVQSASGLQSHERAIRIQYSGGWSSIYIKRPTELRWYSRLYEPCGYAVSNFGDSYPLFLNTQSINDFQHYLGSNAWQVNLAGGLNPQYQGWDWLASGSPTLSRVSVDEDGYQVLNNTTITGTPGNYGYLEWGKQLTSAIAKQHFANSDSDLLPDSTYPYLKLKGGQAFVCRLVVMVNFGGTFTSGSQVSAESRTMSVSVRLKDEASSPSTAIELLCSFGRDGDNVYVALHENTFSGLSALGSLIIPDSGSIAGSHNTFKWNWTEIVFGMQYPDPIGGGSSVSNVLQPFLYGRPLNKIDDPDLIADFYDAGITSNITPSSFSSWTVDSEHIRIGGMLGGGSNNRFTLGSFQFSRSFLMIESPKADLFTSVSGSAAGSMPRGDNTWLESTHTGIDPTIQAIQQRNGGVFSPMRPSNISAEPQYIERGLNLSLMGKFAKDTGFTYDSVSSFNADEIFETPILKGFRGATNTLTPTIDIVDTGSTVSPSIVPSIEVLFDFGETGVLPEAFAAFGCNSPELAIQFLNDSDLTNDPQPFGENGEGGKSVILMCGTPDSGVSRAWQRIQGDPCQYATTGTPGTYARYTDTLVTYKPRYEFVCGKYFLDETGLSERIVGANELRYSPKFDGIVAVDNPYRIAFNASLSAAQKKLTPFTPHQFRSTEKESFYLQIMPRQSFDSSQKATPRYCFEEFMKPMVPYTHIFKIKDNGRDWVELTSKWTDMFDNAEQTGKFQPGFVTIYSDRAGYNVPDYFSMQSQTTGQAFNEPPVKRYRYARVMLGGGQFWDPSEQYIKLNALIMGKRMELSTRDIDVQYTYNIQSNTNLYTGSSGARVTRKNAEPRKSFSFSYSPRPSPDKLMTPDPKEMANGERASGFESDVRGYGSFYSTALGQNGILENSEQSSSRSHLSWEEIVDRILRLGIKGDVVALAFNGNRMLNLHSNILNTVPANATISPAESSPDNLLPARLTDYGGAANAGYRGRDILKTQTGSLGTTNSTECRPAPIMKISNIKFEEEF